MIFICGAVRGGMLRFAWCGVSVRSVPSTRGDLRDVPSPRTQIRLQQQHIVTLLFMVCLLVHYCAPPSFCIAKQTDTGLQCLLSNAITACPAT
jgi:hypothetical protein